MGERTELTLNRDVSAYRAGGRAIRWKLSMLLVPLLVCLCMTSLIAKTPFERMDSNNDGKLSKSEFRGPPRAFGKLDQDNNGYINRKKASGTRLAGDEKRTIRVESKTPAGKSTELTYVDTHNHLVGRRTKGQYDIYKPSRIALEAMDATGVKLNFLMPMPQVVGQKLRLYLEDLLPIVKKYQDRFAALGGGGSLNVIIQQAIKEGRVTTAMQKEFDTKALELVRKK